MNIEHRTSNVQHRIMYSVNFKKKTEQHAAQAPALHERIYSWKFDSAESFDPESFKSESFNPELTTEGLTTEWLVAGCGLLVLKSIKRSLRLVGVVAPTPRRASSIFEVRCWTFDVRRSICSLFGPGGISYEVSYE